MATNGLASNRLTSQMDTVSILMVQYGGKAVVPLDIVCRDYFASLTVPTLVRKISAGEIQLVLVRVEHSAKSAKGVRIQDLAHYIDTRKTIGTERVNADSAAVRPDSGAPAVARSSERLLVISPAPPPEREGAIEPEMERALTLKMAADLLGVSYATVYSHREELGFFQIGSVWRVWPSILKGRLAAKQEEKSRSREKATILPAKGRAPSYALSPDARKAEREFAELVANTLSGRHRRDGAK